MLKEDFPRTVSVLQATIKIIGAEGVGKSTFIKTASATEDGRSLSETLSVAVDRCLCKITFEEIALESLEDGGTTNNVAAATATAADHNQPRGRQCHGTVILYDVMDKDSLYGVPELLSMPSLHARSSCS